LSAFACSSVKLSETRAGATGQAEQVGVSAATAARGRRGPNLARRRAPFATAPWCVYVTGVNPQSPAPRTLLTTVTGEGFQPVRIYYTVPNKSVATQAFARLACMVEDKRTKRWMWHYEAEVEGLRFSIPRFELPPEVHPIVLGEFRFPTPTSMTLHVRSTERAIEAAKFFAPLFGPSVVPSRVRVINRLFEAHELARGLEGLDRLLDAGVIRIDPEKRARELDAALAAARTEREKRAVMDAHAERSIKSDVPLVEDFPLHAEDETPEFRDLSALLRLRTIRAFEHWNGNTEVTLRDVIERLVGMGD
jgi:hypothetical protein